MTGQDFERSIVHAFNGYAETYAKKLVAYRHYQMRFQPQLFDVLVDSGLPGLYLACECKSIDASKDHSIYFTQHFNRSGGVHQVERESNWLELSGRTGFLVVELRNYEGKRSACFFVPWEYLKGEYCLGRTGLSNDDIIAFSGCRKAAGKYTFDDEFADNVFFTGGV